MYGGNRTTRRVKALGGACLAAGAIIGYRAGETALTRSAEEQLTAQRVIKRRRIESYVDNELRFTVAIGAAGGAHFRCKRI